MFTWFPGVPPALKSVESGKNGDLGRKRGKTRLFWGFPMEMEGYLSQITLNPGRKTPVSAQITRSPGRNTLGAARKTPCPGQPTSAGRRITLGQRQTTRSPTKTTSAAGKKTSCARRTTARARQTTLRARRTTRSRFWRRMKPESCTHFTKVTWTMAVQVKIIWKIF